MANFPYFGRTRIADRLGHGTFVSCGPQDSLSRDSKAACTTVKGFLRDLCGAPPISVALRYLAAVWHFVNGFWGWRRYNVTRPLTIVVLGMHRSGTSCVTRMINGCGASLAVEVIPANASNPLGHWEAFEGLEINDQILRLSGGDWARPPRVLTADGCLRWMMRGFLGRLHCQGTAVWKDPRTVLTFPLWKPMLRNYRIVAMFRHPMSVARSLEKRDGIDVHRGLQLWATYNEQLLEIGDREHAIEWIDFDRDADHLVDVIRKTISGTGLVCDEQIERIYAPQNRTADERTELKDDRVTSLYARLRAKTQAEK
jgi:hypothetical protein